MSKKHIMNVVGNQEYCDLMNKAADEKGNDGVLLMMRGLETLEEMYRKGEVEPLPEKKDGKTVWQLTEKGRKKIKRESDGIKQYINTLVE